MSPSSIATEPSASPGFFVFSPKRWFSSRASSPTSSVSRARFVSGGKYPSLYWPIQRSTVCCVSRRDKRTEEHTSELQSLAYLVCRLLLVKKKKRIAEKYTP